MTSQVETFYFLIHHKRFEWCCLLHNFDIVLIYVSPPFVITQCFCVSDLANAALKIQAGFRGHIARKQTKKTDELPSKMTGLNMVSKDRSIFHIVNLNTSEARGIY